VSNLLVLPGLGSLAAGRRSGYGQVVLTLIGLGLFCWWGASYVEQWVRLLQRPELGESPWAIGLAGIGLCGVGWGWALVSSISMVRASSAKP
jgi:hypothetical protein